MKEYIIQNEKLMSEWDWEKNTNYDPKKLTISSGKKVWWKCEKRHAWQATIANRNSGRGCPYCSGRRAIQGYNDLLTVNPTLALEWNYEKNGNLSPSMLKISSGKKAWWKCEKGHEWQASLNNRKKGVGCPICAKELQTSFPEQAIYFYLKKIFPDAMNRDCRLGMELDVFIPSIKVAIEYDGAHWHRYNKNDEKKNKLCKENNIILIRVQESVNEDMIENEYLKIVPCHYSDNGLKNAIKTIADILDINIDVDLNRDRANIYIFFINNEKELSLLKLNPVLAKEWNVEKNGDLKPDMVAVNSNKKVWWICNKGHEWQAVINNRTNGTGCPYCSGRLAISDFNDLSTLNPALAKEWNYEKNGDLKPNDVTINSEIKVWWKCQNGHEWQAKITNRNKGVGCPYCNNRKILVGYNDFATTHPNLLTEWNYEKNGNLTPNKFLPNSKNEVWWKCIKGHEWKMSIFNRSKGRGCQICGTQKILKGYNDISSKNPKLIREWNYGRNGNLTPDMFTVNSSEKVWWKCDKGHEWQATIVNRNKGRSCPACGNKQVIKGYNDLKTINPSVASEWNYEKNGSLKPDMVTPNSNKKVWWVCQKHHEWQAMIGSRNKGAGCPYCSGRSAIAGYNDLLTTNHILAEEWNYEKNGNLKPAMVTAGSGKNVWWKCERGHEWQARIADRNRGRSCPICAKEKHRHL